MDPADKDSPDGHFPAHTHWEDLLQGASQACAEVAGWTAKPSLVAPSFPGHTALQRQASAFSHLHLQLHIAHNSCKEHPHIAQWAHSEGNSVSVLVVEWAYKSTLALPPWDNSPLPPIQWAAAIRAVNNRLSSICIQIDKETNTKQQQQLKAALRALQHDFRCKQCTFKKELLLNQPSIQLW